MLLWATNIGTTITAFIIGFDVGAYSLPILAVGAVLLFFFKNLKVNNVGQIMFGFGALFYGLELMSGGMKPLRSLESFHDLTVSLSDHPLLGVAAGTIFTIVVQSSSATIGILQGLYSESLIDIHAALPVLFGDNIGTTITAVLAAIGSAVAARRAAAVHVIFNLIGTLLFMLLLKPFTALIVWFQTELNLNPEMTIAFAHGTFNVTNTLIQLPFVAVLAWIVTKLIPGEDVFVDYKAKHLDPIFISQSPSLALGQAKQEVIRMGEFAVKGLEDSLEFLQTKQSKYKDNAYQIEEALNNLDRKITDYLVQLSSSSLSENESEEHHHLMDSIRDIERIGDHYENILELVEYQLANKVKLTGSAMDDLEEMFTLTVTTVKEALTSLEKRDQGLAEHIITQEEKIDKMERRFRKKHILRLTNGECSGQAGIVFVDIISNLERIGDHAMNIAQAAMSEKQ